MSEPSIDPERLAALIDGRLDDVERQRLLGELARSDDALDVLADAAAVLGELEAEAAVPAEAPPAAAPAPAAAGGEHGARPRPAAPRGRRWGGASGALAAAAVALLAAGLWYRSRAAGPVAADPGDPGALIALVEAPPGGWERAGGAGDDALTPVPWPATRGAGEPLGARARAIRYGAEAVQLELAARTRDTAAVARLAGQVAALLEPAAGSAPAADVYRAVAAAPGAGAETLAARLRDGWAAGAAAVGEEDARLGAWLAAARAAAARRDAGFFRTPASRRAAARLAAPPDADDATRAALARLRAAVEEGSAPRWEEVGRDAGMALAALGG